MITRYRNLYNKHEEEKCDRIFSLKKCGLFTKKITPKCNNKYKFDDDDYNQRQSIHNFN